MHTIAVVNQKGGCGKTTTTINLAGFLALEGRRTLIVDMDPQGHSTLGLLTDSARLSKTMYDVFVQHINGRETRLPDIIRSVHAGRRYVDPEIAASALSESDCPLTARELEILAAVRGGAPIAEVAAAVHLAPGTVRNYLSAAMAKLGYSFRS